MLLQCFSDSHCLITSESCLCSALKGAVLIGMADWHVCAFSNAMKKTALKDSFSGSWWCIYYVYVYIVPYFESTQVPYSEKIELSLIVLIHCHGFWWFLHVETPMNLMLFVSYIFFVMCRQNPLRGTSMGDAELGLVVLKARNWSFFFENWIARFNLLGEGVCFSQGPKKGFLGKKCFTFPPFKWWCLWSLLLRRGTGP